MLLVDDDQADVGQRREHGRARSDADARLAACAAAATRRAARPRPSPEWSTATTSPNRAWNRADGLRRERDLGHEHDRAASGGERRLDRPQVDLGLARAGDAVEQEPPLRAAVIGAVERLASSASRCSPVSAGAPSRPASDRHRRPAGGAGGPRASNVDEPAALRAGAAWRSRAAPRPRRPSRPSASSAARWRSVRRLAAAQRAARPPRSARRPAPALAEPRRRAGRQHERERPRGRRAVLARRSSPPARPGRAGRPGGSTASGSASRSGASSDSARQLEHHAERLPLAERDAQQRLRPRRRPGPGAAGSRTARAPRACASAARPGRSDSGVLARWACMESPEGRVRPG